MAAAHCVVELSQPPEECLDGEAQQQRESAAEQRSGALLEVNHLCRGAHKFPRLKPLKTFGVPWHGSATGLMSWSACYTTTLMHVDSAGIGWKSQDNDGGRG